NAPLGSLGTLALFYPFTPGTVGSTWLILAFCAYLVSYARDLKHNGNHGSDLFRVLALNAMLLPINVAGAINSLQQLWTGRKIPSHRTLEVDVRTAAPPAQFAAQLGLGVFASGATRPRVAAGEWLAGLLFLACVLAFGYGLHVFIGGRAALAGLCGGFAPGRC